MALSGGGPNTTKKPLDTQGDQTPMRKGSLAPSLLMTVTFTVALSWGRSEVARFTLG